MHRSPTDLVVWARTETGRKAVRYSVVSAISIVVSQVVLFGTYGVLRLAPAVDCNIIATAVATVPSYYLNRRWAWGKTGTSHLWREVVPFWAVAFVGLAVSLGAVGLADGLAHRARLDHLSTALAVNAASLSAYGLMWVGKFILFNRVLFADRTGPEPVDYVEAGIAD